MATDGRSRSLGNILGQPPLRLPLFRKVQHERLEVQSQRMTVSCLAAGRREGFLQTRTLVYSLPGVNLAAFVLERRVTLRVLQ